LLVCCQIPRYERKCWGAREIFSCAASDVLNHGRVTSNPSFTLCKGLPTPKNLVFRQPADRLKNVFIGAAIGWVPGRFKATLGIGSSTTTRVARDTLRFATLLKPNGCNPCHGCRVCELLYTIIFRNRSAAIRRTVTPMANRIKAFSHNSVSPALRKITPRLISIM